jgi:hypothetical protein
VGGALAVVALAALAACSSSGSAGGGQASTPTLYDKYSKPLTQKQDAIHTACVQMISQECVNDIEQLKSMMNDIRVDVGKASGKFTRLLASIDQVDKDYQLFKDKNCGTGNINYNCNVLAASTIVRDSVTVNGNLASTD